MTTIKELNKKIESLTKEVKDFKKVGQRLMKKENPYLHKWINLPVTINT